jgi:hypothetical protein
VDARRRNVERGETSAGLPVDEKKVAPMPDGAPHEFLADGGRMVHSVSGSSLDVRRGPPAARRTSMIAI